MHNNKTDVRWNQSKNPQKIEKCSNMNKLWTDYKNSDIQFTNNLHKIK